MSAGYRELGEHPPVPGGEAAAYVVPAGDGFSDPHGLAVREDVLAAVGEPLPVRAGGLADLVARLEEAGHEVVPVDTPAPPRRATPGALHREGSARMWLFRRHPERYPLPKPGELSFLRLIPMALGALRANARRA